MYATHRTTVSTGDAVALGIIATGAVSVAVAALVAGVRAAFEVFGTDPTVAMPVTGGDVEALDGVTDITAAVYTSADVTFASLPTAVSWLLLLEVALPALATIGVCAVAWWLGVSLIRGRPFRASMPAAIGVVACLVIAGGLFGQFAGAWGRAMLVEHLAATDEAVTDVFWIFLLPLDLTPIGWGFALALVAGAFQIGSRLQRDTEGLV
ncbi:hypothetical protein JNB63_18615 [Microbacterium trichothecenolyticum]|uniref:DUF2975 domain-containing protein n=1 Tax=Microbacterium ureisolvens TaxID=2781186 RepID=A0ABS7I593_9MICO|nr:hypothetical protein [Microbacterium ureisolvens]MBW9122112.1 hypothetical protein [Microbacterium trichothecenolyticum]